MNKLFFVSIIFALILCGCKNTETDLLDEYDGRDLITEQKNNSHSYSENEEINIDITISDNVIVDESIVLPRYNTYTNSMKSIETGFQVVQFGSYEQDGIIENGTETIDWYVLDEEEDKIMLISKYALDYRMFNNSGGRITWETSDLRNWLNDEFFNTAFDENEQGLIFDTIVENPDNHWTGVKGGNDTVDKVYILSFDEICHYFTICWQVGGYDDELMTIMSQDALCTPTDYVAIVNQIDWQNKFEAMSFEDGDYADHGFTEEAFGVIGIGLWCRTPAGKEHNTFIYSTPQHFCTASTSGVGLRNKEGVRPVIWVDKSVVYDN